MKKMLLGGIAIVAIAVAVALNVNMKSNDHGLSDLARSNAEALAVKDPNFNLCASDPTGAAICNVYDKALRCPCGM